MAQQTDSASTDRIVLRRPGQNMAEGITPAVGVPDYERALLQHTALCEALKLCGASVAVLRADPLFPDGSFIGDIAVATERLAVISNFPESNPRQGEQQATASVLAGSHFLKFVTSPGLLDAGDVLNLGGRFYIGLSDHTNQEGAAQLAFFLKEFGHEATVIRTEDSNILNLRSAAAPLGDNRILIREELARNYAFLEYEKIVVPREERAAAGSLMINGTLVMPQGCPKTRTEVRMLGIPFVEVNVSEFEQAGGTLASLALPLPSVEKGNIVLGDWNKKAA